MDVTRDKLRYAPQATMACFNILSLLAFAVSPNAHLYPMGMVAIMAFTLAHLFLPACWVNMQWTVCPGNFAQFFFWLQIVLVPILIGYYGPSLGTLSRLPPEDLINFAMGLRVLGYVSFCLAFQLISWPGTAQPKTNEPKDVEPFSNLTLAIIAAFAAIGFIGWWFNYGGIGGFIAYATSPDEQRIRDEEVTSITGALGNFLRHFLGFSLVWAWSEWVQRQDRSKNLLSIILVTAAIACTLIIANFSYNRGNMAVPLLAVTAAFSKHVRRISFTIAGAGGVSVLAVAMIFGEYRAKSVELTEFSMDQVSSISEQQWIIDEIQVYASGPQLTACILESLETESLTEKHGTLLSSILYPLPIYGKPFRETSGVIRFNHMVYGDANNYDQSIPYDGELYLNFHSVGVAVGYFVLGCLAAFVHRRFSFAQQPVTSYAWMILGFWIIFPASFPVLSQIYLYSLWPMYTYACLKLVPLTIHPVPDPVTRVSQSP